MCEVDEKSGHDKIEWRFLFGTECEISGSVEIMNCLTSIRFIFRPLEADVDDICSEHQGEDPQTVEMITQYMDRQKF